MTRTHTEINGKTVSERHPRRAINNSTAATATATAKAAATATTTTAYFHYQVR